MSKLANFLPFVEGGKLLPNLGIEIASFGLLGKDRNLTHPFSSQENIDFDQIKSDAWQYGYHLNL